MWSNQLPKYFAVLLKTERWAHISYVCFFLFHFIFGEFGKYYYNVYLRLQKQNRKSISRFVSNVELVAYSITRITLNVFSIQWSRRFNFGHFFPFFFFIVFRFVCFCRRNRLGHLCVDSNSKLHPHFLNTKPTQAYTQDYQFRHTEHCIHSLLIPFPVSAYVCQKLFRLMFA